MAKTSIPQLIKNTCPEFRRPELMCNLKALPGVYVGILVKEKRVQLLYIGSSKNVLRRTNTQTHPCNSLKVDGIVVFKAIYTPNYKHLEIEMIKKYNPPLNKTYKEVAIG